MLFSKFNLNNVAFNNRFVRSATHEGMADDETGKMTHEVTKILTDLASNDVGMIITGHAYVSPEGKAGENQLSATSAEAIASCADAIKNVHMLNSRIILQLNHAGCFAVDKTHSISPDSITLPEIQRIINCFANAAAEAEKNGFDGVQIHAAHGYLLSEFLTPHYNHRTDKYADGILFAVETVKAVRAKVSTTFPVLMKINADDFMNDGYSDILLPALKQLTQAGVDCFEFSGGVPDSPAQSSSVRTVKINSGDPAYYENIIASIREKITVPIILVGGIRFRETAERLLESGICDFVSFSRPLIREPNLAKRWNSGNNAPATCINCNGCFKPILTGRGYYCPAELKDSGKKK